MVALTALTLGHETDTKMMQMECHRVVNTLCFVDCGVDLSLLEVVTQHVLGALGNLKWALVCRVESSCDLCVAPHLEGCMRAQALPQCIICFGA